MNKTIAASALLLFAACGKAPQENQPQEAVMPMTAAKPARPAIDEALPSTLETATFALG